jgi:hypothetical protein
MGTNFWIGIATANSTTGRNAVTKRRYQILSIAGGLTLALLIGGGLLLVAALNG